MANNVIIPATGSGSATPTVETIDTTGVGGPQRQSITVSDRAGGNVDSIGGLTETAPSTDTASSGLNGRLQRIAQRLTTLIGLTSNLTPAAGATSTVATGGTAVTVIAGPCNGGYVVNPANAAAQGIGSAENAYLDMVGTPGSTDATAGSGTSMILFPGQSFTIPALALGVSVKVNAATSGHLLTVVKW